MTLCFAQFSPETDLSPEGKAPLWVQLFPKGPKLETVDNRSFVLDNPEGIIAHFKKENRPLAIDYEHGQAHKAPQGIEAPAAGWINDLEMRDDGLYGKVEWTKRAADMIGDREYRFLSPEFIVTKTKPHTILQLRGAGLVNRPAFTMRALSSRTTQLTQSETLMPYPLLTEKLSLKKDANEQDVLTALTALEKKHEDEIAKLKKENETALAAAQSNDQTNALASLSSKLEQTQSALAAMQKEAHERDVSEALDAAIKEGKITPASRDTYKAICAKEGGLETFNKLVATLPVIAAAQNFNLADIESAPEDEPAILAQKAQDYQNNEAQHGRKVSMSEAVAHIQKSASKTAS